MKNNVRWGLIGAGDIAEKRVAPALRDAQRSQLVAVSRRQQDRANEFARRFGIERVHGRWEDLVADPEIDAVYLATPVDLHARMAIAAAEAGKHILCEKPMALDVADCDRMIEAAERAGVRLGVAYYRHLFPLVLRLRELLAGGTLGTPVLAQASAYERFNPPPDHPRAWLLDPERSGGGPMFDFGCHRIEVLLDLLGPATRATGVTTNAAFERSAEDTAAALFQFASGAVATLTVSHAADEPRDTLDVFCTGGSVHIARLSGSELRVARGGVESDETHPPAENVHQPLVEQFVNSVLDGESPVVDGAAAREVNRVLAAIYGR
ncbi:MAG: Gfo/Idh/MocA family oxidoreductase [Gemmatimonadetes bacterium]|nr:Gfo/Idh/MocA family oxidoreductase [Gemmatimonadota bacterium]